MYICIENKVRPVAVTVNSLVMCGSIQAMAESSSHVDTSYNGMPVNMLYLRVLFKTAYLLPIFFHFIFFSFHFIYIFFSFHFLCKRTL